MNITQMLIKALQMAVNAHDDQIDKGGELYVMHLIRVMNKMNTAELKIIALLHDIVEDTAVTMSDIYEIFTIEIANAVNAITRRDKESYKEYIDRVKQNKLATIVKIADLEDNMDVTRLFKVTDSDINRVKKYHRFWMYLNE